MLEIGLNIVWQNIEHTAAIMDSSADYLLANVMLCGEDDFNLKESSSTTSSYLSNSTTSTNLLDNSDISIMAFNSSGSVGSDRKHYESSIIIISDTSDSAANSSPIKNNHDLRLEIPVPVLYEDSSKMLSPDRSKRITPDKDITLTQSPKR